MIQRIQSLKSLDFSPYLKWAVGFFLAALVLWCISLGNVALRDWDEGTYALIARELYQNGNPLYLTEFGQPHFLKPPLAYWLIASSYYLFGTVNEFTSRFPLALITACGVPLMYLVGRELFTKHTQAIFAASVYLTLFPVVRHGRLTMLDGIINTFLILLLLCLLKAWKKPIWGIGIGLCFSAIALTKGLLVIALGAIILTFILIDRQWKTLKNLWLWLGIILGLSITVGWYALQVQKYGQIFLDVHLQAQGFKRLTSAVEGNNGPPWYYLFELLKYSFPWLIFLPGGLRLMWVKRNTSFSRLILIGSLLFFVLISLMGTKLPWYIMPYYPFFALTIGFYFGELWEENQTYSIYWALVMVLVSFLSLLGGFILLLTNPQLPLILSSLVLTITLVSGGINVYRNQRIFIPILFGGVYLTILLIMTSYSWVWELNEAFPVKPVAALIQENTPEKTVIYTSFEYNRPSLNFYSERQVISSPRDTLKNLWETQHYLLVDYGTLETLKIPLDAIKGEAEKQGFVLVGPLQSE